MRPVYVRIVGVTFADPDGIKRGRLIHAARNAGGEGRWHAPTPGRAVSRDGNPLLLGERLPAVLIRDPGNEHDRNAVQVHVPVVGADGMLGHLPRGAASRWAPRLDAGEAVACAVAEVWVHPDRPDNPGIDVVLWKVDT